MNFLRSNLKYDSDSPTSAAANVFEATNWQMSRDQCRLPT